MVSGGASRHENAATASPAETAAMTAAWPPPTKTSFHSMPAAAKAELKLLTPANYIGNAIEQAKRI